MARHYRLTESQITALTAHFEALQQQQNVQVALCINPVVPAEQTLHEWLAQHPELAHPTQKRCAVAVNTAQRQFACTVSPSLRALLSADALPQAADAFAHLIGQGKLPEAILTAVSLLVPAQANN